MKIKLIGKGREIVLINVKKYILVGMDCRVILSNPLTNYVDIEENFGLIKKVKILDLN